jgi:CRISPR-associated protein Cas5h
MEKIISIDLKGDFGFFRKPDANNTINLSYNMLHKPALLGILGAIVGLEGYKEKGVFPEYYQKLKNLKIGISPLGDENGNFQKTVIKYSNTVGYANKGTTYLTEEATLIKPAYRVFILVNLENELECKLFNHLKNGIAEYIPYFGKNEHFAWWEKESFKEYEFKEVSKPESTFSINTLFEKSENISSKTDDFFDLLSADFGKSPFLYFERLPISFNEILYQYQLGDFVYATFNFSNDMSINNLYQLDNHEGLFYLT